MANTTTHELNFSVGDKVKEASPAVTSWENAMYANFPSAIYDKDFVEHTYQILNRYGFTNNNTLPCVCLCRDEICSRFHDAIDRQWQSDCSDVNSGDEETYSRSFTFSSLAGMLNLGTTGIRAALSHSPVDEAGKRRYVFFAFPHVGINKAGSLGKVERAGITEVAHACGALLLFRKELKSGQVQTLLDPTDIEYSLLKQRLLKLIDLSSGVIPSVKEITEIAYQVIVEDLTNLLSLVDPKLADIAVITGIQIHAPQNTTYIQPGKMYVVEGGITKPIDLSSPPGRRRRNTVA